MCKKFEQIINSLQILFQIIEVKSMKKEESSNKKSKDSLFLNKESWERNEFFAQLLKVGKWKVSFKITRTWYL